MDNENLIASIKASLMQALPQEQKISLCSEHINLGRFEHEHTCTNASIYKPMITFMINGQKQAWVGDTFLNYKPGDIFITGIEIPVQLMIKGASEQNPGFAISVCVDPSILQEVMSQLPPLDQQELLQCEFSANSDLATSSELLTINRIVDLYSQGITYDFPYTLLIKELYFYILTSKHGMSLRKLFTNGAPDYKIAQVIHYLRKHFRQDVAIDSLAQMVYMAVPTFYKHFKQVTCMSPLQYIKRLRLYEAKRLMISSNLTAAAAGYKVGYSSEQHFSRDYKKLFGKPPSQDIRGSIFLQYNNPFTESIDNEIDKLIPEETTCDVDVNKICPLSTNLTTNTPCNLSTL